ncbi:MAG: sulfotransferase, partial [Actinomycetota bacterium]|nr:sulfotransferase [Actinomycetota bacterium]
MKRDEAPVKVLYIMGSGRSGSTVLDIVLGNHPVMESVGELTNLPRSGWGGAPVTRSSICACGRRVADCPFWSAVRREWVARVGEEGAARYPTLRASFERYRRLPRLLAELRRPSDRFREYGGLTRALFEAIRATSGKEVVVDSSKNPLRALALSDTPGVDLRLIHLTRDARGVVASRKKAFKKDEGAGLARDIKPQPVWSSAALWIFFNLLSELACRRVGPEKSVRVRYEAFAQRPAVTLKAIGALV